MDLELLEEALLEIAIEESKIACDDSIDTELQNAIFNNDVEKIKECRKKIKTRQNAQNAQMAQVENK